MKTMQEGSIGSRLVEARGKLSQGEFAARIGVHRNSLSRYEAGENEPSAEVLQKICELGFNMNWLLTGEGEPRLDNAPQGECGSLLIGSRIKQIRGAASQEEFAADMGVVKGTVWRYERGDRMPDAAFLLRLFERFGYSPTWVLTGESDPSLGEATQATQVIKTQSEQVGARFVQLRLDARSGAVGHLFGNTYWHEALTNYAGESVIVRFDPTELHQSVQVYSQQNVLICQAECASAHGYRDPEAARAHAAKRYAFTKAEKGLARAINEHEVTSKELSSNRNSTQEGKL